MQNSILRKIVKNLNTDYEAVINLVKYKLNNGIVEEDIGKLKKIKHKMFGRATISLLRNKVVYQSIFLTLNKIFIGRAVFVM